MSRNVVLIGRSGHGKSATGNSLLGAKLFKSISNSVRVTTTSELQTRVFPDGQALNVIDTPDLFLSSAQPESIEKEVAKWIHMVEDGLHAILVVLSLRKQFTDEAKAVLLSLKRIFGKRIYRYIILVFTSGDDLEGNGETLGQYMFRCIRSQQPVRELLDICNTSVAFDNRTKDEKKKAEQIEHLFEMINEVMELNGGCSFSDSKFVEMLSTRELPCMNHKVNVLEVAVSKEDMSKVMIETMNSFQEHQSFEEIFNETMNSFQEHLTESFKEILNETLNTFKEHLTESFKEIFDEKIKNLVQLWEEGETPKLSCSIVLGHEDI